MLFDVLKLEQSLAHKQDLLSCVQSLLALGVEICWHSANQSPTAANRRPQTYRRAQPLAAFANELALNAHALLSFAELELLLMTIKLPWLVTLICEHLLNAYDESLLPLVTDPHRPLTLKAIVSKCFFLLPPLTSAARAESPHKKLRKSLDCDVSAADGAVVSERVDIPRLYASCFVIMANVT